MHELRKLGTRQVTARSAQAYGRKHVDTEKMNSFLKHIDRNKVNPSQPTNAVREIIAKKKGVWLIMCKSVRNCAHKRARSSGWNSSKSGAEL
eukprot:3299084-Pleurochrysis_carterae.AAC.2